MASDPSPGAATMSARVRLTGWLDRVFALEEINGAHRCPTYLYRWTLASTRWFNLYLHHFVGDDWSHDLHDHPKRFISIGLRGRYIEETPAPGGTSDRLFVAPWVRTFPAEHVHRLRMLDGGDCWTLVVTLRAVRPWGFWHAGTWIPWLEYVRGAARELADARKACP